MFKYIKVFLVIFCGFLFSCNLSNNRTLKIDFSADSTTINCTNIDPAGLRQLKNNLKTDSAYQKLVSVLQTPADDDSTSMEIAWPGKLIMQGDTLVFTPDSTFKKGKTYLVETMLNTHFAIKKEVLRSEVGHTVKPQQKILVR